MASRRTQSGAGDKPNDQISALKELTIAEALIIGDPRVSMDWKELVYLGAVKHLVASIVN